MESSTYSTQHNQPPVDTISSLLTDNVSFIQNSMGASSDLIYKEIRNNDSLKMLLVYLDGLIDMQQLNGHILSSLLSIESEKIVVLSAHEQVDYILKQALVAAHSGSFTSTQELFSRMLSGHVILLMEGNSQGIWVDAAGWEERSVGEPLSQGVVRGPMEGFTENLRTNTALVRKRIQDQRLWIGTKKIGAVTKTSVAIMYLEHLADQKVLAELNRRLDSIEIDSILESGYIEEEIQDTAFTPFPTIYNTERPDTIAAGILEGRIAIFVDGTPFVLLVPALFIQFFQSAEDYYQRADISTLLRLIRFLSFFIALLAPAFYIAITTFHQEMLPTNLLISLAAQREGVPFPAFIEALLMEVTYEILREAGVRIPKTVGQAVSIVGTLVIGQAAVEAGVVSAAMVIIVSITAISTYVVPENGMSIAVRMMRFVFMMLAASFGLFGILLGLLAMTLHLTTLRSFGVPYTSPFGPFIAGDIKDTVLRVNWPLMRTRPRSFGSETSPRSQKRSYRQKKRRRMW
ncbi:spore germination protein [Paenibacillus massiliensis]|uniref:spore germination protein n=1 Tax=Paenibacillus massiliensis TaxID=225917 RepID=UPI0003FE4D90|nr:spore germination protein [Paenibacillus massiliensis]